MTECSIDRRNFLTGTCAVGVTVAHLTTTPAAWAIAVPGEGLVSRADYREVSSAIAQYWRRNWGGAPGGFIVGRAIQLQKTLLLFSERYFSEFKEFPTNVQIFAGSVYFLTREFSEIWTGVGCNCQHCFMFASRQITGAANTHHGEIINRLRVVRDVNADPRYKSWPDPFSRLEGGVDRQCRLKPAYRTDRSSSSRAAGIASWFVDTMRERRAA